MNLSHILTIFAGAAQGDPRKFTGHMAVYDEPWQQAVDLGLINTDDTMTVRGADFVSEFHLGEWESVDFDDPQVEDALEWLENYVL